MAHYTGPGCPCPRTRWQSFVKRHASGRDIRADLSSKDKRTTSRPRQRLARYASLHDAVVGTETPEAAVVLLAEQVLSATALHVIWKEGYAAS